MGPEHDLDPVLRQRVDRAAAVDAVVCAETVAPGPVMLIAASWKSQNRLEETVPVADPLPNARYATP